MHLVVYPTDRSPSPAQIEASSTLDDDISSIIEKHQQRFPHALLHSIHYY